MLDAARRQCGLDESAVRAQVPKLCATDSLEPFSDRVQPGVVYTTFHHPLTGTNVITTDNSDWATNCPEYKVTAVQVRPTNQFSRWQEEFREAARRVEAGVVAAG